MASRINSVTLNVPDFQPEIGPMTLEAMADLFRRWVDAGKPDTIPPKPEAE